MELQDRQLLSDVTSFLEEKLKTDLKNVCITGHNHIQWSEYQLDPLDPLDPNQSDKDDCDDLILKSQVTLHVQRSYLKRLSFWDVEIDISFNYKDDSSYVKIESGLLDYLFCKERRAALKLLKKCKNIKQLSEIDRAYNIYAKIQPDRIENILLGEKDDSTQENRDDSRVPR